MRSVRGFTLIEVMIALLIGAMAVMIAHAAFGATIAFGEHVVTDSEEMSESFAGRRLLRDCLGSLVLGGDSIAFDGRSGSATFTAAWPESASRWSLLLADGHVLLAGTHDSLLFDAGTGSLSIDYLAEASAGARWLPEWRSAVTAPVGIRLRLWHAAPRGGADTLLIAIGTRG